MLASWAAGSDTINMATSQPSAFTVVQKLCGSTKLWGEVGQGSWEISNILKVPTLIRFFHVWGFSLLVLGHKSIKIQCPRELNDETEFTFIKPASGIHWMWKDPAHEVKGRLCGAHRGCHQHAEEDVKDFLTAPACL